eukprot:gb/GEZN01013024.1/.p1 GENE.gb/GEZN01013024.1/~~gb/GEZN01013024.1/.p1  ORF type:complete len:183 (+),score=43.50 gb/GEZN01013024.1/:2-550(+)
MAECALYEAPDLGNFCKICQKGKKKHTAEAIKKGEDAKAARAAAAQEAEDAKKTKKPPCDLFVPPAHGDFCKTCQRSKKSHSERAIAEGMEAYEILLAELELAREMEKITVEARDPCGDFEPADIGRLCKVCQVDIDKHAPEAVSEEARELVELQTSEDGLMGEEAELEKLIAAEQAKLQEG